VTHHKSDDRAFHRKLKNESICHHAKSAAPRATERCQNYHENLLPIVAIALDDESEPATSSPRDPKDNYLEACITKVLMDKTFHVI
jgi:hypothetical protein